MQYLLRLCRVVGLAIMIAVLATPALAAGKRVALVVGNSAYAHADRLANPGNDARLIAQALRQAGFALIGDAAQVDLTKAGFDSAVRKFGQAIDGADVALFYYAGHGLQVDGTNWLVPVDAAYSRPQDLEFVMLDAGSVLRQMEAAGTRLNLVILDACRDNPFLAGLGRGRGSQARGLAQIQAPEGTLISYATQPGASALDGSGADSPFSLALAEALRQPGLELFQVFNQVGVRVKAGTGGKQVPWMSNSPIDGSFYFIPSGATATPPPPPSPPAKDLEGVFWQSIAASTDPADFQDYLKRYPQGTFTTLAQRKLASLQKPAVVPKGTPPPARPEGTAADSRARGYAAVERSDYAEAMRWYRQAADQGDAAAQASVGSLYGRGLGVPQDFAEAMRWYRKASDQGFAEAQYTVGALYEQGLGAAQDYQEAMRWYRRAADKGNAEAQFHIGVMYVVSHGVAQNLTEAMRWYRKAADQGHPEAQNNLGAFYHNGQGVPQDTTEAMRWYRLAAAQGNPDAQNNIGVLYEYGMGVPRDLAEARRWYRLAAAQGHADAQKRLAALGG